MTDFIPMYGMVFAKLGIGLLAIILQINVMGKGNLAPTSAQDQLQNYTWWYYRCDYLESCH